ncbi:hypothetical protein BCR32DRAFT_246443 [Anaeromyces robustus]|uniref:Ankyrin n=1 Tax=Anaeromyces robustus TaxID=1754192 RepID=A0A1Y1X172_9FUNG|nr:hypothetical protein BCR32DRAFT_246443 [Anaeromyces robustus]|eukprot:ORX79358.1 hypothetical protein BCR32DRAFT_246443 [Anaeromyces robustus]
MKLKIFLIEKNLKLEDLNDDHFNVKRYTFSLFNQKLITREMRDFIIIYSDNKKKETIEIIEKNNVEILEKYIHEKNIEFKDLDTDHLNLINHINELYKNDVISKKIRKLIFLHYDSTIGEIIKLIQNKDFYSFKNYITEHNYKLYNKKYFDIIEALYSKIFLFPIRLNMLVLDFFKKRKCIIVEYFFNNNFTDLKNYIKENNISELVELNDSYFNIIEFYRSFRKAISSEMMTYIISHLYKERFKIVEMIDENKFNDLKEYTEANQIEFKNLNNEDEGFHILKYCEMSRVASEIKEYIILHYDNKRYQLIQFIDAIINRSKYLKSLKSYMKEKNIDFKSINDENFNILRYCDSKNGINSYDVRNFIINHYYRKRGIVVDLIESSNLRELKIYLIENNLKMEDLNDRLFDIRQYTYSLYDEGLITEEMKDFITIYSDKKKKEIIEIVERNRLDDLKQYVQEKKLKFKFKELNDGRLNIIYYINNLCNSGIISSLIRFYIFYNYDELIGKIIELIQRNNLDDLKNFIINNKLNYKILNKNYFDIIESLFSDRFNARTFKLKDFILMFFDNKKYELINIIMKNNLNELIYFKKENHIEEFMELNNQYFNIIDFCRSSDKISSKIKLYISSHLYRCRSKVVDMIDRNEFSDLQNYTENNHLEFKNLNDDDFNIIKYCEVKNVSSTIKNHILIHYDKMRYKIVTLIKNIIESKRNHENTIGERNSQTNQQQQDNEQQLINEFKEYVINNYIQFQNINDEYFDITEYLNIKNNKTIVNFIINHYSDQRSKILNYIKNNNLYELKSYTNENLIILENLNTNVFDILSYSIKYLNPSVDMVNFIIQQKGHYDFTIYKNLKVSKFPLYLALSMDNYEMATTLLNNKMDINYHGNNLIKRLIKNTKNVNAIKYLIHNDYKKEFIIDIVKNLIHDQNNIKILKMIFNYYIFDNNFIINLLYFGKKQISLTQNQLQNIITNEKNKLGNIDNYESIANIYGNNKVCQFFKTFNDNYSVLQRLNSKENISMFPLSPINRTSFRRKLFL